MKASSTFIVAFMIVSISIFALPALAYEEPSVGVKKGDWIEYEVSITGKGSMPPTHDVRRFRMEVLPVQGTSFSVNLTSKYANGTIGTAIWKFNFTKGNVEGWIIIPSNLGKGDTFYDYSIHTGKPVNVTIQSQERKPVLGASRDVTYGNDSLRHKEWDKASGMFIGSTEVHKNVTTRTGWFIEDLTVTIQAIATNIWNPETILGLRPLTFYALVATIILLIALILVSVFVARKQKISTLNLSASSQGKIAVLTILFTILFEVANMLMSPFYGMGLTISEINLIMQTLWTALVIVSMWYRWKGNYFLHEIIMLIVMCAWWVGFSAVLLMNPFSTSTEIFSNTPLRLIMNALHAIFSIPALVFGTWLVAIWRPASTTFPSKRRRVAHLTIICWIPSYVVGVLDFMVLHTTIFG